MPRGPRGSSWRKPAAKPFPFKGDSGDENVCSALVQATVDKLGHLDILVNYADSIQAFGPSAYLLPYASTKGAIGTTRDIA